MTRFFIINVLADVNPQILIPALMIVKHINTGLEGKIEEKLQVCIP